MMNVPSRLLSLLPVLALLAQEGSSPPPGAAIHPVTDDYFGQRIVDPYRWTEDEKNPELRAWIRRKASTHAPILTTYPITLHFSIALAKSKPAMFKSSGLSAPAGVTFT